MKKFLSLALVFVLLFAFCGCDKKDSKKGNQQSLSKNITASNGDKIEIELTSGNNPKITVSVNNSEIYSFDNFSKYKDNYDFNKDFNLNVGDEYAQDQILWAYKFDWGVIYSTKYSLSDGGENTISYVCPKHDYKKSYFKNAYYYKLAEEWNLIEFDAIEETGKEIFWDSYTAAQVVFEELYKTEDYTLNEISDLEKAGYSFDEYYDMHQLEFSSGSGLNQWQKIYEISVKGKPFALIYSDASTAHFLFQELDWPHAYQVYCHYTENGAEYYMSLPNDLKITKIS